jgi:hypothetical protein
MGATAILRSLEKEAAVHECDDIRKQRISKIVLGRAFGTVVEYCGTAAPYVATWLIATTGSPQAPAWVLIGTAGVSLGTALTVPCPSRSNAQFM